MSGKEAIEILRHILAMTEYTEVYTDEDGNDIPASITAEREREADALRFAINEIETNKGVE